MKLRYFYKIDHKKQPIPGSNIRRKSRPGATHQWKEILDPCCSPLIVNCTCGPRFFVQLDGKGKPVDHSLIKRWGIPEMTDGVKYYEIDWMSPCCSGQIGWNLQNIQFLNGSLQIYINGVQVLNQLSTGSGTITFPSGAVIRVVMTVPDGSNCSSITINKDGNNVDADFESGGFDETYTDWSVDGGPYIISANIADGICGE